MNEKENLPSLQDLYSDKEMAVKRNQLEVLLNQPPKQEWLKKHPIYKNYYLPIERIEWLLTRIFGRWWVEVKEVKHMLNSAVVTIRLWVIDPLTGGEIFQDGVGAHNFQLDKDAAADDFSKLKNTAVMLAVPIAESRAISDAADKYGNLFGKDLNREQQMKYTVTKGMVKLTEAAVEQRVGEINTKQELVEYWRTIPYFHTNQKLITLFKNRQNEIE